jgi:hypothetical protein
MLRHHAAGRMILKAISKGALGAALVMADLGNKQNMEEDQLSALSRLPLWLAPPDVQMDQDRLARFLRMKPDGVVVVNAQKHRVCRETVIHVIELKYCSDTMPELQQGRAEAQHIALMAELKLWGCTVHLHVILLGAGGSIYSTLKNTVKMLGVEGREYQTLANNLHCLAAEYAEKAMALRFARTANYSGTAIHNASSARNASAAHNPMSQANLGPGSSSSRLQWPTGHPGASMRGGRVRPSPKGTGRIHRASAGNLVNKPP